MTFDLHDTTSIDDIGTVTPSLNQLLTKIPPDYREIGPDLALKWEFSDGGKTLTMTLASSVVDHNGNPFTCSDAKFSLERIANPDQVNSGDYAGVWESIQCPNDTTLVIRFPAPQAAIVGKLASQSASMYTQASVNAGDITTEDMGTGPFRLKLHAPGEFIEFERYDNYFKKGLPYLDGLKIFSISDASRRIAAFEVKQIDVILLGSSHGLLPSTWQEVEARHRGEMGWITGIHYSGRGITINFLKKDAPWQDIRVRRAMDLAIDRQASLTVMPEAAIYGSYMAPTGLWNIPVEKQMQRPGYRQPKDADIAEAKRLLAAAGYPNGFTINAMVRDTSDYRDYHAPFIAAQLRQNLGIESVLQVTESARRTERLRTGDFEMEYGVLWGADMDDPDLFLYNGVCGTAANYGRWCNEQYDELVRQQSVTIDPVERKRLVNQAMEIMYDELPLIDVWWATRNAGWWNYVKNVPREENSGQYSAARRFEYVWLDK